MALANRQVPGVHDGSGPAIPVPYLVLSADGAITLSDGVVVITKGSAAALTIDAPPTEGVHILDIISTTAAAHTVTHTPGFGGGTTSRDVATWGGAISDGMRLIGYNGVWYVGSTRNVSLG
jgi:hypothetical protein